MKFCVKLLFIALFFTSCTDTCNKEDTFKKITIEKKRFIDNNLEINFSIDVLDKLPEKYFKDFYLKTGNTYPFEDDIENSHKSLKEVKVDKTKIDITILKDFLPDLEQEKSFCFILKFGDRKDYIDCSHPGGPDSYYLKLEMKLKRTDVKSIELSDFKWKEKFKAGAY